MSNYLWDALESAMWAADRPQQAVFQGAKAGSKYFGDQMREGSNPVLAALSSLPAFAGGAMSGMTGLGKDVRGRDLSGGLADALNEYGVDSPYSQKLDDIVGFFLDMTASPTDIIAPGSKVLGTALHNRKILSKAAPEAVDAFRRIGNPLTNVPKMIKRGLGGVSEGLSHALEGNAGRLATVAADQPVNRTRVGKLENFVNNMREMQREALGTWGGDIWMANAPKKATDLDPTIIRQNAETVDPWLINSLWPNLNKPATEPSGGAFYSRMQNLNKPGNEIVSAYKRRGNLFHEMTHYIQDLIKGIYNPAINVEKAQGDYVTNLAKYSNKVRDRLPEILANKRQVAPALYRGGADEMAGAVPTLTKAISDPSTSYNTPKKVKDEVIARLVGEQMNYPSLLRERFPAEGTPPEFNSWVKAIRNMVSDPDYLPLQALDGPPPPSATQPFGVARRYFNQE